MGHLMGCCEDALEDGNIVWEECGNHLCNSAIYGTM